MADGIVGALTGLFRGRGRDDELARIDAEITAFGESLARHSFVPGHHSGDAGLLADYQRALDAYEQAKQNFVGDRDIRDAADVLRSLDEGRHALACVDAATEGRPRPERRPLCFFDPRHGPSTAEADWAPPEGAVRTIAVCAADAVRLSEGVRPIATGLWERQPGPHPQTSPERRPTATPAREARTRTPSPRVPVAAEQPAPSPGPSALYGTWPPETGVQQRRKGHGSTGVQLVRPARREPALLVVHLDRAEDSWVELSDPPGERGVPRKILTHGSVLTRAIVPVPPDGRDRVILRMATKHGWRIWLHPLNRVPDLTEDVRSTGTYVSSAPRWPDAPARHPERGSRLLAARTPSGLHTRGPPDRRRGTVHGIGHHVETAGFPVRPVGRFLEHRTGRWCAQGAHHLVSPGAVPLIPHSPVLTPGPRSSSRDER